MTSPAQLYMFMDVESRWEGAVLARHGTFSEFLTNLDQPMPRREKISKLSRNLWRRVILRQTCCGHPGEPGC